MHGCTNTHARRRGTRRVEIKARYIPGVRPNSLAVLHAKKHLYLLSSHTILTHPPPSLNLLCCLAKATFDEDGEWTGGSLVTIRGKTCGGQAKNGVIEVKASEVTLRSFTADGM